MQERDDARCDHLLTACILHHFGTLDPDGLYMNSSGRFSLHRRAFAVLAGLGLIAIGLPASADPDTTFQGSPIHNITKSVVTKSGSSLGQFAFHVLVRDIDDLAWADATNISLPAGHYQVSECVVAIPSTTTSAPPCTTVNFNQTTAGTVHLNMLALSAIRPLSGGIGFSGYINVRSYTGAVLNPGTYGSSWSAASPTTIAVDPIGPALPQDRGSMVHLFKPGTTLQQMATDLDALKAVGATIVRTSFPWPIVQPQHTTSFDPGAVATIDAFLQLAQDRGLKVLAIFGSTPCWASSAPLNVLAGCLLDTGQWGAYPPTKQSDLAAAVTEFATRWGTKLAGVELENEPNNTNFFVGTPAQYVQDVKTEYAAIKIVAPQLTVVAGVLALSDTTWLNQAYAAGLAGNYDALSVHAYNVVLDGIVQKTGDPLAVFTNEPSEYSTVLGLAAVRQAMIKAGDGAKPIWVTEFGFSDCTPVSALCVSDADQAKFLDESLRLLARASYVPVVMTYNTRDVVDAVAIWNYNFGFIHTDGTPKSLMTTVQTTLACLAATTC